MTDADEVVSTEPAASRTETCTAGSTLSPAAVFVGWAVTASFDDGVAPLLKATS